MKRKIICISRLFFSQQIAKHHIDTEQDDQSLLSNISTGVTSVLENSCISMVTEIGKSVDPDGTATITSTAPMQDIANI